MLVVGLLSTEEEALELQFIAKVCTVENQIRNAARVARLKRLVTDHF